MARPAESVYFSRQEGDEITLAILNDGDVEMYLRRLSLSDQVDLRAAPSLELLSTLLLAHHLTVPFDTTSVHTFERDWQATSPSKPMQLGKGGDGMRILTRDNFDRVVRYHRGGYCFSLNSLFAALLRSFGFRVSEVGARVYMNRGQDPAKAGWAWTAISHVALLVSWDGATAAKGERVRYLADVGFGGGGCAFPIELRHGTTQKSLSKTESFKLIFEKLPIGEAHADPAEGFMLYRRVAARGHQIASAETADQTPGHWTPCYHFTVATQSPSDIEMANFFNEKSDRAVWHQLLTVSKLLPNGARRTLLKIPAREGEPEGAKLYTKQGVQGDEYDVSWIPFDTASIRAVLEREFGYRFDTT